MFFTKDDDCIVCNPKGEYLKRNRKGEKRMLEKCLEKCVFCGAKKMVKSETIREMFQSEEAVLLEPAQITSIEGSELLEGDIVRVTGLVGFNKLDEAVCVIRKSEQYLGLVFYSIGSGVEHRIYYDDSDYVCEYLGNIYLTPEVIEEELFKKK